MKFGKTLKAGLAVVTGAAIGALVVSTAAGTTTASGSNTVFVHGGTTVNRGGETLFTNGTGGGTSTPPRRGGMTGGTGI